MTQETEAAVDDATVLRVVDIEAIAKVATEEVMQAFSFSTLEGPENLRARLNIAARNAAYNAARAAIAAYEATLRPAIEAEIVAWMRDSACAAFCDGEDGGDEFQYCANAIERGDYRQQKGSVDGK